jgi:membrane-associated phospholipid phosphatase
MYYDMIRSIYVVGLFFIVLFYNSYSQNTSPYSLTLKHESVYAAYTISGLSVIYLLNNKLNTHTEEEISNLNAQDIWKIDRNTVTKYSDKTALLSDYTTAGACAFSIGISALVSYRITKGSSMFVKQAGLLAVLWSETLATTMITANIVKSSVQRTRPYVYNSNVPLEKRMEYDGRKSFFSGHTTFAASNTFFAAHVVSQYFPKTWLSYSTWAVAGLLPASVAYMRVDSGRHFPTDVITGYIVGAACGIVIPHLHTLQNKQNATVHMGISPQTISFVVRL